MRAGSSNPSEGKRRRPHARGRCGWGEVKRLLAKGNGPGAGGRELLKSFQPAFTPAPRLQPCSGSPAAASAAPAVGRPPGSAPVPTDLLDEGVKRLLCSCPASQVTERPSGAGPQLHLKYHHRWVIRHCS